MVTTTMQLENAQEARQDVEAVQDDKAVESIIETLLDGRRVFVSQVHDLHPNQHARMMALLRKESMLLHDHIDDGREVYVAVHKDECGPLVSDAWPQPDYWMNFVHDRRVAQRDYVSLQVFNVTSQADAKRRVFEFLQSIAAIVEADGLVDAADDGDEVEAAA